MPAVGSGPGGRRVTNTGLGGGPTGKTPRGAGGANNNFNNNNNLNNKSFESNDSVEYYSKSAGGKWISCIVKQVQNDGTLILNYPDGSVLKEGADPIHVRKVGSDSKGPTPVTNPSDTPASAVSKNSLITGTNNNNNNRKSTPGLGLNNKPGFGVNNSDRKLSGFGNGVNGNRMNINRDNGPSNNNNIANNGPGNSESDKNSTWNSQKLYVGDRAKIQQTGRHGDVLFIGRIPALGTALQVGMKLDEKRRTSECDGRYGSERYFRCPPGYGVFLSIDEVEVVTKGTEKENSENLEHCRLVFEPPCKGGSDNDDDHGSGGPGSLDFDTALNKFYALDSAKASMRKVKHWVEVQRKRYEAASAMNSNQKDKIDIGLQPLTFIFQGNTGTGMTSIAKVLAHLLRDLGCLSRGHVIETSRKEIAAVYGEGEKTVQKIWKAAQGGILFVEDVGIGSEQEGSKGSSSSSSSTLEEAYYSLARSYDSMARQFNGPWPQPVCLILSCKQASTLPERLLPVLQQCQAKSFDFDDYDEQTIVQILRSNIAERDFTFVTNNNSNCLNSMNSMNQMQYQSSINSMSENNISSSDNNSSESDVLLSVVREAVVGGLATEYPNGKLAQKLLNDAIARQTERVWAKNTLSWEGLTTLHEKDFHLEQKNAQEQEDALQKLDKIIGLTDVKSFVRSLHAQLSIDVKRRIQGINVGGSTSQTLHMIFTGNPGTGKTTVARVIADLLKSLGMLRKGHLVEADRSGLVAAYCGQTALKTKAVVESALGGVLFIDEAYALIQSSGNDSFGHEALDTLIKLTEDHRGNLVVILAGYSNEMQKLIDTNPGLNSRFPNKLHFQDYTLEEMYGIGESMVQGDGLSFANKACKAAFKRRLEELGSKHGNGRDVRNIIEEAARNMAVRLQQERKTSKSDLTTLQASDFNP